MQLWAPLFVNEGDAAGFDDDPISRDGFPSTTTSEAIRQSKVRRGIARLKEAFMPILEVFAHLTVRPGQLEGFRKQAAECIRITKEKDTRTLRYDWYLTSDGTECEVHEAYTGPEGLIEHNSHILEARTKLFKDYADNHFMTVYGEASQPLLDLFKAHRVGFKWFDFVEGLEGSAASPSRIPVAVGETRQPA